MNGIRMRSIATGVMVVCGWALGAWVAGCGDKPIGQPCTFNWPKNAQGTDCSAYPSCHPLQEEVGTKVDINDLACPVDCIQMPSMECENLICVATQIPSGAYKNTNANGQCGAVGGNCTKDSDCQFGQQCTTGKCVIVSTIECPTTPITCSGYCTKECLSDASCPEGYTCSHMAPFGANLHCNDNPTDPESLWGTGCTDTCIKAGITPSGATNPCPATATQPRDYTLCDQKEYGKCCACICYQFCPITTEKFCRKKDWDKSMFPNATTKATTCGGGSG